MRKSVQSVTVPQSYRKNRYSFLVIKLSIPPLKALQGTNSRNKYWHLLSTMSSFSLSYEQISEDLAAIEDSGIDTAILAQLVKQSGAPQSDDEKSAFIWIHSCSCA